LRLEIPLTMNHDDRATASLTPTEKCTRVRLEQEDPMARKLSKRGAQFIARFEGFRPKLYNDPVGHCTIGIGHLVHRGKCNGTEPAPFKKGLTRAQAYELLQKDARRMEKAVNSLRVPLNQHQFDALVSFTFNLGPGWVRQKTTLGSALRERRYRDVPAALKLWNKAGSPPRPLAGLTRRRAAEGRLFARGYGGPRPGKPGPKVVNFADVQPGKTNNSILLVQKALQKAVGLDYSSGPGTFGPRTKKAYAAWQRKVGFTSAAANGKPDPKTLKMLGAKYGFTVRGAR
jgi:GH24 family phage-related lysozyme (muramidase)